MAKYRSKRYRRSIGHEKALEHIREAEQLSHQLGGTDKDVQRYLFSLSTHELGEILSEYGLDYGSSARDYAVKTMPRWRAGEVHMSGLVAERLYKLLPPRMPIESKFGLVESLWNHVGPSSEKTFYVGVNSSQDEVSQVVREHLERAITQHGIPEHFEARFKWLSAGDVRVKQQLLNFFRHKEKTLVQEALRTHVPVLLDHLRKDASNHTQQIKLLYH